MPFRLLFLLLSMFGTWFPDPAGGSGGEGGGDDDDSSDDDDGDDDDSSDDDDGDDDDSSDDDDGDDDGAEIREALKKERGLRKAAERRLRQLRRERRDGAGGDGKGGGGQSGKGDDEGSDDGGEWKTRFEALDRRYRTETVRNRVSAAAAKRNAIDPAAVSRLVELDDVAFDDKGETITNLGDLMDELVEDFPKLFRKSPGKGNGGDEPGRPRKVKPGLDRLTAAYTTESKTKSA